MRREVVNSIDKEFSYFLPKVPSNFYRWVNGEVKHALY